MVENYIEKKVNNVISITIDSNNKIIFALLNFMYNENKLHEQLWKEGRKSLS